jgi:hypothetical protein
MLPCVKLKRKILDSREVIKYQKKFNNNNIHFGVDISIMVSYNNIRGHELT